MRDALPRSPIPASQTPISLGNPSRSDDDYPRLTARPGIDVMPLASPPRVNSLYGVGVSITLHAAALGVLLLIHLPIPAEFPTDPVTSRWSPAEAPALMIEPELLIAPNRAPVAATALPAMDLTPESSAAEIPDLAIEVGSIATGQNAAKLKSATGPRKGRSGTGRGTGQGTGAGQPFFEIPRPGESIVFIVDNSRSMNHPHDSEFKTRFRRVKAELIQCIAQMPADGRFSVIFFSREVYPLPAPGLRSADPATKDAALRWVGAMESGGSPTDPRQAVALGLRLQPDRIYFLTDGEFERGANLALIKLRQERTAIDTFAFGERLGEDVLRQLAEHNRGRYTFVP